MDRPRHEKIYALYRDPKASTLELLVTRTLKDSLPTYLVVELAVDRLVILVDHLEGV